MTRLSIVLYPTLLCAGLLCCTREDGLPDPPLRQLVPCAPDSGSGDPLTCAKDAEVDGAAGSAEPPDAGL